MRKIILYTAVSLDGQIAPLDGSIDWLDRFPGGDTDHGFSEMYDSIDTILIGNQTYKQAMGFEGPPPFKGKRVYVLSRDRTLSEEPVVVKEAVVSYIVNDPLDTVRVLRAAEGKHIWLCGGGQVNSLMLGAGLIDEMTLTYVPIVLGPGIPLFAAPVPETLVRLVDTRAWMPSLAQMTYQR